jgi:hypothetical protein
VNTFSSRLPAEVAPSTLQPAASLVRVRRRFSRRRASDMAWALAVFGFVFLFVICTGQARRDRKARRAQ